jgi:hypothetical protein
MKKLLLQITFDTDRYGFVCSICGCVENKFLALSGATISGANHVDRLHHPEKDLT